MNRNIVFCLFALATLLSCSLRQTELPSKTQDDEPGSRGSRLERQILPPPLAVKGKTFFPTVLHPNDQTVMVLINAGVKLQSREVKPFYIDQHEITVKKFTAFNQKYSEKPYTGNRICPNCPAMGIDWFKANQYCQWAGKRLPTEAEWEFAAQGPAGNPWPWGKQFLPKHANLAGEEDGYPLASPVGSFPQGSSPYGVLDMIGNVWEWVSDSAETTNSKNVQRILKGGSWLTLPQSITISFRSITDPALKNPAFGFRCSKSLS